MAEQTDDTREHPELIMGNHFHARHAGKYVAFYLTMLVLLGVMGGVYAWQHKNLVTKEAQLQTLQTQAGSLNKQAASVAVLNQSVSTANWKTYCDLSHKECFKYPANWTVSTDQMDFDRFGYVIVTLANPTKSVQVSYSNAFIKDGFAGTVHPNILANMSDPSLKLVGGYMLASTSFKPFIAAVNNDSTSQALQVNALGQMATPSFFTDKNTKMQAQFSGGPVNGFPASGQADGWFKTTDAQTVRAVIGSMYYS